MIELNTPNKRLFSTGATKDLSPLLDTYVDHLTNANKAPRTCYLYKHIMANFLAQFPAPAPIDIDTHFTLLRARASASTCQDQAAAIKSSLRFC